MLTQNFACSESVPGANTFLPETIMKVYLILGLLVTIACAEKKINLEDIERDNLKAENKVKNENIQTDETKYAAQPNQQQYQIPNQYTTLNSNSDPYIYPQDVKYSVPPEGYNQLNQYLVHEAQYKQPSQILTQQIPSIQYYRGYQQQAEIPTNAGASTVFESQKLSYQPEIPVGNYIQSVQQKAATEKYTKAGNKESAYLEVPVTRLLSYYPQVNINSLGGKSAGLGQPLLHQSANNAAQQFSIPVYAPIYNQKQLVPSTKAAYSTVVPGTFRTKASKGSAYTLPITSKKINLSTLLTSPVYVQPQQSLTKGKTLLHTQAYITPSQPRYVQQLVYTQPGIVYADPAAAYSDIYARLPAYIEDNSLRGQINQYQTQQQYYITSLVPEAQKNILQEQISQDLPQNYVKTPEEPKTHFVPPQLPSQDFKSGITQLAPVPFEDERSLPAQDQSLSVQDHSLPTEPRSLLDTYIPSKIIAAQDTARYRERPIKLEGGFLPSKVNFALKKRKTE